MKKIIFVASAILFSYFFRDVSGYAGRPKDKGNNNLEIRPESYSGKRMIIFPKSDKKVVNSKFGAVNQLAAGVNIHFVGGHEIDLDMIAAAGFKFIRMDFQWQGIERTKGIYNWKSFDELTANLEKRNLRAIYILDYSNSLYEESADSKDPLTGKEQRGTASPQHPESIEAFARWAAAAAEHYKNSNIIWEIWNEPNISFWKPKPDVAQYIALSLATCKAIKAVVPDATIIGPASSGMPWLYLETFMASGIMDYLDAISVHPYRNYKFSPETAITDYQKLKALIARYAPAQKKNMPVISSEWGYSSSTKGVSLDKQAAFSVRMQLANLSYGIPISIWYDWKNDGPDPADHESNFGTVTPDLKPKPAYNALRIMNKQLEGHTFSGKLNLKSDSDFVLVFKNEKGISKLCAWTTGMDHSVSIENKIQKVESALITDGNNNRLKTIIEKGKLVLNLTALPQYILLPKGLMMK
jgi:hypothetical protein